MSAHDTLQPGRIGRFSQEAYKEHGGLIYETPTGERVLVTCACSRPSSEGCCGWLDLQDVGPVTRWVGKSLPSESARRRDENTTQILDHLNRMLQGGHQWPVNVSNHGTETREWLNAFRLMTVTVYGLPQKKGPPR